MEATEATEATEAVEAMEAAKAMEAMEATKAVKHLTIQQVILSDRCTIVVRCCGLDVFVIFITQCCKTVEIAFPSVRNTREICQIDGFFQ